MSLKSVVVPREIILVRTLFCFLLLFVIARIIKYVMGVKDVRTQRNPLLRVPSQNFIDEVHTGPIST